MMMQQCFYSWKAAKNYFKGFFKFIKRNRKIWATQHQKILNLLYDASESKLVNIANNQLNGNYDAENEVIYDTEVL